MPVVTLRPDAILAGMPTFADGPTLAAVPILACRRPSGLARLAAMLAAASLLAAACAPGPTAGPTGPSGSRSPETSPVAVATAPPCPPGPAASQAPAPWWQDAVFYEVFVRSFADSDGDGVGDLRGLIDHLDYLQDLGIRGIWLMPVAEAASYHGYDVVNYRAIERDYGTVADFRALVAAAHTRGIAIITDLVVNHTSIENPWFQDARRPGSVHDHWYVWSNTNPGYGGPHGEQVWYPEGKRFFYAQFSETMPDLNLANPVVTNELEGIARYWLDDLGVDGFRLDAIKHLIEDGQQQVNTPATHEWLAGFHAAVRAAKPDALLVGEVYDLTLISSSYVPDAVDLTFDFELADKMLLGSRIGEAGSLASAQRDTLKRYGGRSYAAFLTNHDQTRTMSSLNDGGSARAAATLLLTNPGVPFVYYGEELGLTGAKPDERIRSPMPWTPSGPAAGFTTGTPWEPLEAGSAATNVAAESTDPGSLLAHYRALIQLRDAHPALRIGSFVPLDSASRAVYAFIATLGGDRVAVIVNLGAEAETGYDLRLAKSATCGVASVAVAYANGVSAAAIPVPPAVTGDGTFVGWRPVPLLPAHSTLVLTLD